MTKITHVKIKHYIDDKKNNANKWSNACCTFTCFPRDFKLNTTDPLFPTVGGRGAVNQMFI